MSTQPLTLPDMIRSVSTDPRAWFLCGHDLLVAAGALKSSLLARYPDLFTGPPDYEQVRLAIGETRAFLLLASAAAENLVKGLWLVSQPTPLMDPTSVIPRRIATHNIEKLAREANLALTADEFALLSFLRDCTVWYARYPFPRKNSNTYRLFGTQASRVAPIADLLEHLVRLSGALSVPGRA